MNKLGRCLQGDAKPNIKALYLQFQRKRILKMGFFVPMFQLVGANLDPRSIIWTNLVEFHQKMVHTIYQSSSPYGLGQEDFQKFLPISLCEIQKPTTEDLFPF